MENHWRKPPLSDHYNGHRFHNLLPTPMFGEGRSMLSIIRDRFKRPADLQPSADIPFVLTDLKSGTASDTDLIWFGHSSYLIRHAGMNILVDPVLSGHASPVSFMIPAFPGADHYRPADMPEIDLLIISHDHYDHLDKDSIAALAPKVRAAITPLGVGDFLHRLGIAEERISETDWGETLNPLPGVSLSATPARHFSGRSLLRDRSLWNSYVLELTDCRLFIGADSGYGPHFRDIGNRYGPFDLALLECGQYSSNWPYIHMMPEETAQAALNLKAKRLMPVHWGKFSLSNHPWTEPPERLLKAAEKMPLEITTPMIGERMEIKGPPAEKRWWRMNPEGSD